MDIRHTSAAAASSPTAIPDRSTPLTAASATTARMETNHIAADPTEHPYVQASTDQVAQALKSINAVLQTRSQDLEFSVDNDSAQMIVKVTDKTTHEVIRQMPTKEALEIAKALDRLQSLLKPQTA